MGSSIRGTRLSLMVAYASRAPSGDHQWATWDRRISSGGERNMFETHVNDDDGITRGVENVFVNVR